MNRKCARDGFSRDGDSLASCTSYIPHEHRLSDVNVSRHGSPGLVKTFYVTDASQSQSNLTTIRYLDGKWKVREQYHDYPAIQPLLTNSSGGFMGDLVFNGGRL